MHRRGAAARRDGRQAAPDAEAGGAAAPGDPGLHHAGRGHPRPLPRHRHDRGRGAAARAPLHRAGTRPGLCRGRGGAHRGDRADLGECRAGHRRQAGTAAAALRHVGRARHDPAGIDPDRPCPALERDGRRRWLDPLRPGAGLDPPGGDRRSRRRRVATAGPSGMSSCRAGSCGCSTSTGPKCSASAEGLGRAAPSPVLAAPVSAPPRW